jgi:rhamnosyl/mannosyltransferase
MVLVEAAMYGKPMICCEVGSGTSFVNQNQETGFVIRPENPGELSAAANKLLEDRHLASTMGIAARARYETYFSGKALGQAYVALYKKALEAQARR